MVTDAETAHSPREQGPRLSWAALAVILTTLVIAGGVAGTYADIQRTIGVQGEQIATVQRQFSQFDRDVRGALGIEKRRD
jgi:hypothetical protein